MKSFGEYMCPELHIYWPEKVGKEVIARKREFHS